MLGKRKPPSYGSGGGGAPAKRRKKRDAIEEITYDSVAREEYLTGFHKRKLQRVKTAQEQAVKQAREERVRARKRLREQRKADLEGHVEAVNAAIRQQAGVLDSSDGSGGEEEGAEGGDAKAKARSLNRRQEYGDEDQLTTVTIEAVDVTREGLRRVRDDESEEEEEDDDGVQHGKDKGPTAEQDASKADEPVPKKKKWWASKDGNGPKKKKKKFRYESKAERKVNRVKERSGGRRMAAARREE